MRKLVLALIALACMVPPAEAARRDERGTSVSRQAPAKAPAQSQTRSTQRPAASAPRATQSTARQQPASRQQAARGQSSRQPASRTTGRQAALQPGDVRTSQGGMLMRSASAATVSREAASCTRRNGRTVCGQPRQASARSSVAGWQSGLMPVDYAQRECPEGTFATLARGHENVVRCMPI